MRHIHGETVENAAYGAGQPGLKCGAMSGRAAGEAPRHIGADSERDAARQPWHRIRDCGKLTAPLAR